MRLIDADALIGGIKENNLGEWYVGRIDGKSEEVIPTDTVYKIIDSAPSIEPKRGEWIDMGDFEQCSVCKGTHLKEFQSYYGKTTWIKTPYCPNCGAKMKGADDEDN